MREGEHLILTGFMGTGKTHVGREIARRLGRELVDMDALIEAREGATVAEIFARQGEAHFRHLEATLCRELAARPEGVVIATGGGALLPDDNMEIMAASGPVVCLTASPEEILRRLEAAGDRPLLEAGDRAGRVSMLLTQRAEAYARIPLQVDTTGQTAAQVAERVMAATKTRPATSVRVRYPGGEYQVRLGWGLLAQTGRLLRGEGLEGRVVLVTDHTVGDLYAEAVRQSLVAAGFEIALCLVADGEAHKTLDTVRVLYDGFIGAGLDRHGAVLALGGGVVGDMAGFAAATYLRGVRLVQLPTTLLAMVDSSVGGKVAVDHPQGKNLIGAFKQPWLVIADPETLDTLPAAELANGLAETVKAGLIGDPALFQQIQDHGPAPLAWLIKRAVRVKAGIVEGDPYERGRRAVLNLGHTFGHALELLSDYTLAHGAAVSVGLAAAVRLSARLGLCDRAVVSDVEGVLARLGLATTYRDGAPIDVWRAMATDKKRRGGRLHFVLLRAVGDAFVTDQVEQGDVLAVLETLREA
jgi:shikimate kinase/3-dehydroquinate synthase